MGKLKDRKVKGSEGYFLIDAAVSVILILIMLTVLSGFLISVSVSLAKTVRKDTELLKSENAVYGKTYETPEK